MALWCWNECLLKLTKSTWFYGAVSTICLIHSIRNQRLFACLLCFLLFGFYCYYAQTISINATASVCHKLCGNGHKKLLSDWKYEIYLFAFHFSFIMWELVVGNWVVSKHYFSTGFSLFLLKKRRKKKIALTFHNFNIFFWIDIWC